MRSNTLIRQARLRAGLTQRELAERAGTTQSAVARWEGGRARPALETLVALVRACGLELTLALEKPDPGSASLIERNLTLSAEERLDQLVRAVDFVRAGRAAMANRLG